MATSTGGRGNEDGNPLDPKIEEIAKAILDEHPELKSNGAKQDEEFSSLLTARLDEAGLGDPEKPTGLKRLKLCDVWCAHHGDLGQYSALIAYKVAHDHTQSIPAPHAIRMLCADP